MPDYEKMYDALFASISEAINILEKGLRKGEEIFVETDESPEEK